MAITANDIKKLVDKANELSKSLGMRSPEYQDALNELLDKHFQIKKSDDWAPSTGSGKSDAENKASYEDISRLIARMRDTNRGPLKAGWVTFVCTILLLVVLVPLYCYLHRSQEPRAAGLQISDATIVTILETAQRLGDLLAATPPPQTQAEAANTGGELPEPAKAGVDFAALKSLGDDLQKALENGNVLARLSYRTLALWGESKATILNQKPAAAETFEQFRKALGPELEGLRSRYFWMEIPGRWFEIAWWAEFGTLVGVLFYLAMCLGKGVFRPEEVSMILTEIAVAPIVACVVFFLLNYTGIATFNTGESSVVATIGFAFILGFAIRRTVGLLDVIKNKLLPEPTSPTPGTPII